jgi:hypothetical protein
MNCFEVRINQYSFIYFTLSRFLETNTRLATVIYKYELIGRAQTTRENGKWGETKQSSENQVAFNSVLGPS